MGDILIGGETISCIGQKLDMPADRVIDASDKLVIPGGIDPHPHMEFPFGGTTASETVPSRGNVAVDGGEYLGTPGEGRFLKRSTFGWKA